MLPHNPNTAKTTDPIWDSRNSDEPGDNPQQQPDPNTHLTDNERALLNAGEMLWICLANVSNGDWGKQDEVWQKAARRWADNFHNVAKRLNAKVA